MVRYLAVALLALVPTTAVAGGKKDKDLKFEDKLTKDDPRDPRRMAARKIYPVKLKAGRSYTIDMVSRQFDSYLFLDDSTGKELAQDDDGGGMLNARIIFNCPKDGEYKVVCTAFNPDGVGMFTLTVKMSGQVATVASAHALLTGKAAPDFQGDFTLNGKADKLSDLKGKVVLLEFWDVRSGPCAVTFPRLRALSKAHKASGLEVVGVSFYNVDIGQKLGFDKKTGQIKHVAQASRQTEQALLKDFAAHHQLDYLLLTLPMETALKTFDAYAVNGLPQFVLIDRKGVVRTVRVGEAEATALALEGEIKKLLAEK